jgi:hypothetical protein
LTSVGYFHLTFARFNRSYYTKVLFLRNIGNPATSGAIALGQKNRVEVNLDPISFEDYQNSNPVPAKASYI